MSTSDPFNLNGFVEAQERVAHAVTRELREWKTLDILGVD